MREPVLIQEQKQLLQQVASPIEGSVRARRGRQIDRFESQAEAAVNHAKHLLCGLLSALVSKTILAPLERVKMDMVMRHRRGVVKTTALILSEEGYKGLWRGNVANLLRIAPFKAVNFFCYDMYRKALIHNEEGQPEALNPKERLLAGALSGMTACALCFPLDLVRTRVLHSDAYGSAFGALRTIAKQEGLGALYVGCIPAVFSMAPAGAVFYGSYDMLKHNHLQNSAKAGGKDNVLPPAYTLLYGALAGIASECVVYPTEVIRRRMQLQSIPAAAGSRGAAAVAQKRAVGRLRTAVLSIAQEQGLLGYYAGLVPCLAQVLPSAALSYYFFETLKRTLHVKE